MPFQIPNLANASVRSQAMPDSGDFEIIRRGVWDNGVITGCAVTTTTGLSVSVAAGTIRRDDVTANITTGTLTLNAAHATLNRYDLIVINSSNVKAVITGTPASDPSFPAIPDGDAIVLAAIHVAATDVTLSQTDITDKRMFLRDYPPVSTGGGSGGEGWTGVTGFIDVTQAPYNATGNGSTNDRPAIQAAIDASQPGDVIWFPGGDNIYQINAPLIVPAYRKLMGGGLMFANNSATNSRPQIRVASGGTSATWGRMGMITHAYYTGASTDQGPIWVEGLYLNGNGQAVVGAAVVVMGTCNYVRNIHANNLTGTTDWAASGTAGSGYGVIWTTTRYSGVEQGQNAVNSWFKDLRIGSNNCAFFIQRNSPGGITDWILEDLICLIPPDYTHAKDDVRLEATGGALIRHVHTNGTAGSGIHVVGAATGFLRIQDCYLDGFGCGNGSAQYAAVEIDNFVSFDTNTGAPLSISGVQVNHRTAQDGPGTYVAFDINMQNKAEVTINNCTAHVQATAGTHHFFDIGGSDGDCLISNCKANYTVNPNTGGTGVPNIAFTDARIFKGSLNNVNVRVENCNWNYGTAAPSNGQWGVAMRRWNSAPGAGAPMGWVCTAAGAPGTWRPMPNL